MADIKVELDCLRIYDYNGAAKLYKLYCVFQANSVFQCSNWSSRQWRGGIMSKNLQAEAKDSAPIDLILSQILTSWSTIRQFPALFATSFKIKMPKVIQWVDEKGD